jgi:hypothetical protein
MTLAISHLRSETSANLISAWTPMAATGDPSSNSSLQWPSYNTSQSLVVNIDNSTTVGIVNYTVCEFWDKVGATVLNFTAGTATTSAGPANATSAYSSAGQSMSQPQISVETIILVIFGQLTL